MNSYYVDEGLLNKVRTLFEEPARDEADVLIEQQAGGADGFSLKSSCVMPAARFAPAMTGVNKRPAKGCKQNGRR